MKKFLSFYLLMSTITSSVHAIEHTELRKWLELGLAVSALTGIVTKAIIEKRKQKVEEKPLISPLRSNQNLLGLRRAIPDQINILVDCFKNSEKYRAGNNLLIPKGILLHGQPGCGKTALIQALAGEGIPVFAISPSELSASAVGETEAKLRRLYADAINYAQNNNVPFVIVFIDEIDAIGNRSSHNPLWVITQINQLLTLLDGAQQLPNVITIGATNRLQALDPALIRPGRLDWLIEIESPNLQDKKKILFAEFKKHDLQLDEQLAQVAENLLSANITTAMITRIAHTCKILQTFKQEHQLTLATFEQACHWILNHRITAL